MVTLIGCALSYDIRRHCLQALRPGGMVGLSRQLLVLWLLLASCTILGAAASGRRLQQSGVYVIMLREGVLVVWALSCQGVYTKAFCVVVRPYYILTMHGMPTNI